MPHEDYLMICPYFHKTLGNTLFCTAVPAANKENCAAVLYQPRRTQPLAAAVLRRL